jgi:uncharacterized protein YegP (UPF0339 family)
VNVSKYPRTLSENSDSDSELKKGEIIAESRANESKKGCQKGIASVREKAAKAEMKDYTT